MLTLLRWMTIGVGLLLLGGMLLSLSRCPHWFMRGWDFPRVHLAALTALVGAVYGLAFSTWQWYEWAFMAALAAALAWQSSRIVPYTPLAPVQVQRTRAAAPQTSLRILIANVLMHNRQYDRFLNMVCDESPDVILAVEIDDHWLAHLQPLEQGYPYAVRQPQANMYGMLLLSRLELHEPQVRFLVQRDIPSIHTRIALRNGTLIDFYGLHPRPPEPLRDQNATPRDAELVLIGRAIRQHGRPSVVAGDLNDVAWSDTNKLFLRLSRLLDPRAGRGFYNTFHADLPLFRFPLDHVFHSNCFTLIALRRLAHIGSDHFPMCIDLHYEPQAQAEQPEPQQEDGQEQEAQQKIDQARNDPGVWLAHDERSTGVSSTPAQPRVVTTNHGTFSG